MCQILKHLFHRIIMKVFLWIARNFFFSVVDKHIDMNVTDNVNASVKMNASGSQASIF